MVDPDPFLFGLGGIACEEAFKTGAGEGAVPPRTNGDQGPVGFQAIVIGKHAFGFGPCDPAGDGLTGLVATVPVVIAGTDDDPCELLEAFEVFLDDDNLNVDVEWAREVEEIATDDDGIVGAGVGNEPVVLFESVMEVGDEEEFHDSWKGVMSLGLVWNGRLRRGSMDALGLTS
jgi:hypothetical protein